MTAIIYFGEMLVASILAIVLLAISPLRMSSGAAPSFECAEPSFFDRGDVHEHIRAAVIGLNESIALVALNHFTVPVATLVVSHIR